MCKNKENLSNVLNEYSSFYNNMLKVAVDNIERLSDFGRYGRCLSRCNSIVINKERMMTVKVGKDHLTTYEFAPLFPTFFSPSAARMIVENDVYCDYKGKRICMEIVGELEYYRLLKSYAEERLETLKILPY